MKFSEFKEKEVIDCKDGKRLGYVVDLEFDPCSGYIEEICVPGYRKVLDCLKKPKIHRIPFKNIVKIGPDIILVKICDKK
ncbi:MAG: YlmC/YmxH family sporulation protein [Lachnospiraceae bacterium]|nr:YlmC/YmxH family sporulation protein [Lachnospiraceae bacterium]